MDLNNKMTTITRGGGAILSVSLVIGAAMVLALSLSQEASALTQAQKNRLADALDRLADKAEDRGRDALAAKLRAEADRLRGDTGCAPTVCG